MLSGISGITGGKIYLWDIEAGKILRYFDQRNQYPEVAYSPDGKWALSGGEDNNVRLWDVETGKELVLGFATEFG